MKIFRLSILLTLFFLSGLSPVKAVNSTLQKQKDKTTKIENTTSIAPKKSLRQRVKETIKLIFQKPKTKNASEKSKPLGMAKLALIFGILGALTFGILSIPAFILGIISLKRINESGGFYTGRGMAMAGLILGAIPIAIFIFFLGIFFAINGGF